MDELILVLLRERSVLQPGATATAAVRLTAGVGGVTRLGVLSSFTVEKVRGMVATVPVCRHMAGDSWRYKELPT